MTAPCPLEAMLARAYVPAPKIRVGILLVGGALSDEAGLRATDAALVAAGHTALRRRASLQPRAGEADLRVADVIDFLAWYGHEYALAAFRAWPAARGHEPSVTEAARRAGCRILWEIGPNDAPPSAGSDVLLRRMPTSCEAGGRGTAT